ncbi:hypothetical protein GCM10009660_30520 [Catellatospora bangladeshensis]
MAEVQAHLEPGGAAHHRDALGPERREGVLHGRVARDLEHPVRGAVRVGAAFPEHEARGSEEAGEVVDVRGDGPEQLGERAAGRGGDLHLAAGFDGERRPAGQRVLRAAGDERGWCVSAQGCRERVAVERLRRVFAVVDGPFQFDPEQARGAVLEADRGHVSLGLRAVPEHRRGRPRRRGTTDSIHGEHSPCSFLVVSTLHGGTDRNRGAEPLRSNDIRPFPQVRGDVPDSSGESGRGRRPAPPQPGRSACAAKAARESSADSAHRRSTAAASR